jgi:hypothetical protein
MLLIVVSERLPFCVTQLVLFHLVFCFFWNQFTALSEGCLYILWCATIDLFLTL